MTCLLNAENLEPELLSPRSNEPGDTLSACVCVLLSLTSITSNSSNT